MTIRRFPRSRQSALPYPATLDLSFIGRDTLDPRITFTRADATFCASYFDSTGTIQLAAADAPRFDYDPATLQPRGFLIEQSRANLILFSDAPATQSVTVSATAYTLSFYGTGTVTLSGVATATVVGTGAFPTRTTYTFTPTAGSLTLTITGTVEYVNLEAGAFATSWIATTASLATRANDAALVNTLTPWFNATEGTLFSESQQAQDRATGFPVPASISDSGSGVNTIEHYWTNSTSSLGGIVYVSSGNQASLQTSGLTRTAVQKLAFAYKANDFAACVGGGAVGTDTSGTVPVVDRLTIGGRPNGGSNINGWIRRISYYPTRLSNTDLQAITA